MMEDLNKTREQNIALIKWSDNNYRGTYLAITGSGKTKVGVIAAGRHIRKNNKQKWLIVTPTENLRDREWVNEFKKWGYEEELSNVTLECIQTAHKKRNEHWDGIVIDEIDTTITPQFKKLYQYNKFDKILGLTATVEDIDKIKFLDEFAPVIHKTTIDRALELDLVSDFNIYNITVEFTEEEKKLYSDVNLKFIRAFSFFGTSFPMLSMAFSDTKRVASNLNTDVLSVLSTARKCFQLIKFRKDICFLAKSKIDMAKSILEKYKEEKAIIFNEQIDIASKVSDELGDKAVLFHSKLKKKEKIEALDKFGDPDSDIQYISCVRALDRGMNVPDCSLGIVMSGSSKTRQDTQRRGRTIRFQKDKVAKIFNLYVPGTIEEKWVRKRIAKSVNIKWLTSIDEI